jgi:hypothetical protein
MTLAPSRTRQFNLLSIGQRGVGKTVLLAGSYAELCGNPAGSAQTERPRNRWFDCQDPQVQRNLEKILNHIRETGLYPPATIKVTDFNFNLQQQTLWGVKTLCNFHWWDIPGEICTITNPEFQEMVLNSQGCCVFVSAEALVRQQGYTQVLEELFNQVVAIATLVQKHSLNYSFAIILTKCDLLEPGPVSQLKIEQSLQPLITRLDSVKANYQRFYSAIPIVSMGGATTLQSRGAADPLLWLLAELNKHHQFQAAPALGNGLTQSVSLGQVLPPAFQRGLALLVLSSLGMLGVSLGLGFALGLFPRLPTREPAVEQPRSQQPDQVRTEKQQRQTRDGALLRPEETSTTDHP